MEIKQIQSIEGANLYSYSPIIRAIVDLRELKERMTNEFGSFNSRLVRFFPGLNEHYCSRGRPGGFLERLEEGTLFGHVLEHLTIELLILTGQTVRYGKTMRLSDDGSLYEIIFNYQSKAGAIEALNQAANVIEDLLKGNSINLKGILEGIKKINAEKEFGPSTQAIVNACKERGIPVMPLNEGSLLQLGYGKKQHRIQATMTDRTSCIGVDISCDKELTKKVLYEAGLAVPKGYVVDSEEAALESFHKINTPVVIKPYNGNQGKGVSLNLQTDEQVRTGFKLAQNYGEKVILEEYIEGRHYRILVIEGKFIAAAERIPACVVGDGKKTIEELVKDVNSDPRRGEDHENILTKIHIDPVVVLTLAQKGMTINSIPLEGETVFLRQSANLSTGGTAHDVTEIVHPDIKELAVYAAQTVGLDIAGVDLVIKDISESYWEQNGKIIEINAAPGIRMHHFPNSGKGIDVGKKIVEELFPNGNARIPIVAITGTNGKTTTTRMIGKMLCEQGLAVGITTTDGIYINDRLLVKGDTTGPESARIVLRHPDVQVAVLETARGGILRGGLGYDYADIAVITNVDNDHLGIDGIETLGDLAHLKSLVAEVVRPYSYVVLNADDPYVLAMKNKTKGRVILYSLEKDNIHVRKHLGLGGVAVFVRRGIILLCKGTETYKVCTVKSLPATLGGKAKHNIQNALAAIAAGWALGLSTDSIQNSLQNFLPDARNNRGRLNQYNVGGVKVVLDYGHNPAGIKEVIQTLKQFAGRSLVGCLTVPGDRSDESIREVAKIAAMGFDRLIIHEDSDLRNRKPGEVANILYQETLKCGMKPNQVQVILPELDAFITGIESCVPGDIYVTFFEKIEPLEQEIERRLKINPGNNNNHQEVNTLKVGGGII